MTDQNANANFKSDSNANSNSKSDDKNTTSSSSSSATPFRGKVKYENGKIVEEPTIQQSVPHVNIVISTHLDPAINTSNVQDFINESTDNSGTPMIDAAGKLTTIPTVPTIPTTDPSTATQPIVQPLVKPIVMLDPIDKTDKIDNVDNIAIDLPISSLEDWNAMLTRSREVKASGKADRIKSALNKTSSFFKELYESQPDGRATDDVAFSPKGDVVEGGWIPMPEDYPAWFIADVQRMSVMTTDVPIEFLSEADFDRLVTAKGHMVFPIVLHVFTPTNYKGGRLYEYLNEQLADEFAATLDQEMLRGDGMGRPIGLFPRVSMMNDRGTLDEQSIAPPGVRSIRLVGVAPNQEAILDINMFFALEVELLKANNDQPLDNAKWYMNSNTGLMVAEMKDENGEYILDHESITMQMVGVPDKLGSHDIVYNEWIDDLFPGCVPIILGDLTGIYELKVSPRFYIKRLADSAPTMEKGASSPTERQYAIGFYMAAGINLAPPDQVDAPAMPYVGIVIDGLVDKEPVLTEDEMKALKAEFDVYLNGSDKDGASMNKSNKSNDNSMSEATHDINWVDGTPNSSDNTSGTYEAISHPSDVQVKRPDIVITQVSNKPSISDSEPIGDEPTDPDGLNGTPSGSTPNNDVSNSGSE